MNIRTIAESGNRTEPVLTARRSERIYVCMPISLRLRAETSKAKHSASTVDLSELGARVRTDAVLVPGQVLEVIPDEGARDAVPSRVIWVGATGSAAAGEVGLEFLQSLSAPI